VTERRFETVGSYPTPVAAELAAAALREEGIDAQLRDVNTSSVLPHLTSALGYVKLDVPADDAARARQLLRDIETTESDELTDEPRCPQCDSTYLKERGDSFECQRCRHRFAHEDAGEPLHGAGRVGYRARAKSPPGGHDVFRLKRNSKGIGLFVGFLSGSALWMFVAPELAWLIGMSAVGWIAGRQWEYLVCSDPQCRARLRSDTQRCPACNGHVQGDITHAADHWVRRAELKRSRE
jgi:hypothetical protein